MAQKKKVQSRDEVVSKTARASAVKTRGGGLATDANLSRIISLGNGTGAYVRHPVTGECLKFRLTDPAFVTLMAELIEGPYADQLWAEMTTLSAVYGGDWPRVIKALSESNASEA